MNAEVNTNNALICGVVTTTPEFSHEIYGENIFIFYIESERRSEIKDIIPVTISERAIDISEITIGTTIAVSGKFRSFNKHDDMGAHLVLSVFCTEIKILDFDYASNDIEIIGFICKPPKYRQTPLGREICDLLVAVNRQYGKSDYIPVITWGRNAKFSSRLEVGTKVSIKGRIQSREYTKRLEDGTEETRVAYEVSANAIRKE